MHHLLHLTGTVTAQEGVRSMASCPSRRVGQQLPITPVSPNEGHSTVPQSTK